MTAQLKADGVEVDMGELGNRWSCWLVGEPSPMPKSSEYNYAANTAYLKKVFQD